VVPQIPREFFQCEKPALPPRSAIQSDIDFIRNYMEPHRLALAACERKASAVHNLWLEAQTKSKLGVAADK
jgi:hypothetical protein